MAGKRKAEGIALLSVYAASDDDDDAASDSSDEEEEQQRVNGHDVGAPLGVDLGKRDVVAPTSAPRAGVRVAAAGFGIVDYAHDEAAASPELEEGGEAGSEGRPPDIKLEVDNGYVQSSPNGTLASTPSEVTTPKLETDIDGTGAIQSGEAVGTQDDPSREASKEQVEVPAETEFDVLRDFLPPPPPATYSEELQIKFAKYLALKKTGRSLNEQLRNTKGYRNPDFLQRAVKYHEIDQIGSCFKKEVFDPHGYDQADYYDALALEQRREAEKKEQERKQNQRIDFARSSMQNAVGLTKPTLPMIHKIVSITSTTDTVKVEARSSKKSKWDKVELEGRSAQSIAADAIAAANVHAALLSASANAGAGYASFAQQRRRQAEEKLRATEKNALTSSSSKVERKTDNKS